LPLLLLAAACGKIQHAANHNDSVLQARDSLTRHQKDSIVAQSAVPGAGVVGRAMTVQDSGAAHQRLVDSIANAP
ncbi:MAG TPA: hypothetical protein VFI13_10820, partial [Gemmatimonadales bacterium]|nr:hypothetical protein [Gemmatimonadales bacterium]